MKVNKSVNFAYVATASLKGKTVWITGASAGIGEHLAYVLAKAGCKLILTARRAAELERVKKACLEGIIYILRKFLQKNSRAIL